MTSTPTQDVENELLTSLVNGVLTLTINRVEMSNAIPYYVRDRLIEHFTKAHSDLNVRAIVLTGAGDRHFCTGADLRVRPTPPALPEGAPDFIVGSAVEMMRSGFQRLMESMQDCQKPIIAAMNGTAAGGGAMLRAVWRRGRGAGPAARPAGSPPGGRARPPAPPGPAPRWTHSSARRWARRPHASAAWPSSCSPRGGRRRDRDRST